MVSKEAFATIAGMPSLLKSAIRSSRWRHEQGWAMFDEPDATRTKPVSRQRGHSAWQAQRRARAAAPRICSTT